MELNPMQLLMLLKNGNPQSVAQQIIQQNFSDNPFYMNLLQLAQKGDSQSIQQIAQQVLGQSGKDVNSELNNLFSMLKNL